MGVARLLEDEEAAGGLGCGHGDGVSCERIE